MKPLTEHAAFPDQVVWVFFVGFLNEIEMPYIHSALTHEKYKMRISFIVINIKYI